MHIGSEWHRGQAICDNRFCAEKFGLLASFKFGVLTSHSPSLSLFCSALILSIGSTQAVFENAVVFFASGKRKNFFFLKTKGHYLPCKLVQRIHPTQAHNILLFQQKKTLCCAKEKCNILHNSPPALHWYEFCLTLVRAQFHHQFWVPPFESSGTVSAQIAAKRLIRSQQWGGGYEDILKNWCFD